jgi:replicative DNA helicase
MSILEKQIANNWEEYEKARLKQKRGLTTGFRQIDGKLITLPGFVNIMGDTNCFKSATALSILLHNAKKGVPCLLFDNENGLTRTRTRLLCMLGKLSPDSIESGTFYGDERVRYDRAVAELTNLPIYFEDNLTKEVFEGDIRVVGGLHKKKPVLAVVDSLHAFVSGGEKDKDELTEWVNFFNTLKNQYDGWLTIIMICEKSKAEYGAGAKGAKGSGSIDYRNELTLNMYLTKDRQGTIIDCTKNRDGPKGILGVLYPTDPFTYNLCEQEFIAETFD